MTSKVIPINHSLLTPSSDKNDTKIETKLINILQNIIPFYDTYNREFNLENFPINLCNEILSTKCITDIEATTYVYDVKKYTQQTLLETRLQNCLHVLKEFPIIPENKHVQIKSSETKTVIDIKNNELIRIGQLLDIFSFYGDSQMTISKLDFAKNPDTTSSITHIINLTTRSN